MSISKSKILNNFTMVTGALMIIPEANQPADKEMTVMFMSGPAQMPEMRSDAMAIGAEKDMHVVILEYEPGKESEGPSNVAVFGWLEDGTRHLWANCRLWTLSKFGPLFIVSCDEALTFSFNGFDLIYHEGRPKALELMGGFDLAKAALKRAAALELPFEVGKTIYAGPRHRTKH